MSIPSFVVSVLSVLILPMIPMILNAGIRFEFTIGSLRVSIEIGGRPTSELRLT